MTDKTIRQAGRQAFRIVKEIEGKKTQPETHTQFQWHVTTTTTRNQKQWSMVYGVGKKNQEEKKKSERTCLENINFA